MDLADVEDDGVSESRSMMEKKPKETAEQRLQKIYYDKEDLELERAQYARARAWAIRLFTSGLLGISGGMAVIAFLSVAFGIGILISSAILFLVSCAVLGNLHDDKKKSEGYYDFEKRRRRLDRKESEILLENDTP